MSFFVADIHYKICETATLVCLITRFYISLLFLIKNAIKKALHKQSYLNFFLIHYYLLPPKNPYNHFLGKSEEEIGKK